MTAVETARQRRRRVKAARSRVAAATARVKRRQNEARVEDVGLDAESEQLRYRILCIDDDVECAALLRECFSQKGFEVFVAHDALQGLALLLKHQPHLVLSDVSMPGMSGLEILKRLRQIAPDSAETPFIFLTGLSEEERKAAGRTVALSDFIAKPVDFDTLLKAVEGRLRGAPKAVSGAGGLALTDREIEALLWAARGKTRAQIAEIMGITLRTVVFHLTRAQKRLQATTFTEAVVKAALQGLIQP